MQESVHLPFIHQFPSVHPILECGLAAASPSYYTLTRTATGQENKEL